MSKILPLYSTPVITFKFSKHYQYYDMFDTWEKTDRKPDSWLVPLNTSFPEIKDDDPHVDQDIRDKIKEEILFDIRRTLLKYKLPTKIKYDCFWYNAYRKGQGQEIHNHLSVDNTKNPFWSGVYFCKNCNPGSFFFTRHDYALRTQQTFDYVKTNISEYYRDERMMPFTDGDIILFPPHLHHGVKCENITDEQQRLTFSFNISIEK